MLLWAVKDKYFSFIGYFSKNILIFFFFFVQDLLVILYVWYGKNLQSLHIVQAFIIAVFLKQLFVLAAFYYTAFVEYINAIGIFDCR